jgi:hypothetical protein
VQLSEGVALRAHGAPRGVGREQWDLSCARRSTDDSIGPTNEPVSKPAPGVSAAANSRCPTARSAAASAARSSDNSAAKLVGEVAQVCLAQYGLGRFRGPTLSGEGGELPAAALVPGCSLPDQPRNPGAVRSAGLAEATVAGGDSRLDRCEGPGSYRSIGLRDHRPWSSPWLRRATASEPRAQ